MQGQTAGEAGGVGGGRGTGCRGKGRWRKGRRARHSASMPHELNYTAVGSTRIADAHWDAAPVGYRSYQRTVLVGRGPELWRAAASAVMRWGVKIGSGFTIAAEPDEDLRVLEGQDRTLIASLWLLDLREPVRVVAVVDEPDRCGFAYGTREGHPVSGEEAFILHRSPDDDVWLTMRSVTRPAGGGWRLAFPAVLLAQRLYRRRYARSLRHLA